MDRQGQDRFEILDAIKDKYPTARTVQETSHGMDNFSVQVFGDDGIIADYTLAPTYCGGYTYSRNL